MINLNYEKIRKYCLIYITLPVIIFLLGWIRLQYSVIASVLLLFSAYTILKQKNTSEKSIKLSYKMLGVLCLIALVWCFFAGQGGYYYQSADYDCRNAIFRDLINFKWPVIYKFNNTALVYYIGYWMPAALVGKIAFLVSGSASIAWAVGNFALFIWSTCGVVLVFLLLISTVKANTRKKMVATSLLFIFFSGCDALGYLLFKNGFAWHIEWWAGIYQFSSITTCLFWVFNQTVISWIIILCLINEKSIKNFAYIGVMALPAGPFPFLGIFIYCICIAAKHGVKAIKQNKIKEFLKDIFTPQNIFSCLVIVPIYLLYYSSNAAMSSGGSDSNGGINFYWNEINCNLTDELFRYAMFLLLEVAVYAILIYKKNKKNILFYITIISLMIIPLFRMCNSADFAMRVSIPGITVLGFMVIDYLINNFNDLKATKKCKKYTYILLLTIYLIGSVTPMIEFGRGIHNVIIYKKIDLVCDDIKTFNRSGRFDNFITSKYSEKPFYKYLAK